MAEMAITNSIIPKVFKEMNSNRTDGFFSTTLKIVLMATIVLPILTVLADLIKNLFTKAPEATKFQRFVKNPIKKVVNLTAKAASFTAKTISNNKKATAVATVVTYNVITGFMNVRPLAAGVASIPYVGNSMANGTYGFNKIQDLTFQNTWVLAREFVSPTPKSWWQFS